MEQDQQVKDQGLVEEWDGKQGMDVAAWVVLLPQDQAAIASVPVAATRCRMQLDSRAIKCNVPTAVRL